MRVLALTVHGFIKDRCFSRAASLSFITVLSFVPLLAFAFAVAKEFGGYDNLVKHTIVPFLDNTFGAASATKGATLGAGDVRHGIDQILGYISKTNVTSLGVIGSLFLLFTGVELLNTVEDSFNDIWGVKRSRPFWRKMANYISIIAITPIILVSATGITAAFKNNSAMLWLKSLLHLGPMLRFVPLLMLALGLIFVYTSMPHTRIRMKSAILGGIVAGLLWQFAQVLHLESQISIARYNKLYAGFAALPIFLVWIYIAWLAVLIGAELASAHQHEPGYKRPPWLLPNDHAFRQRLTLRLMLLVGQQFVRAKRPWTIPQLADQLGVYESAVESIIEPLVSHDLLALSGEQGHVQVLVTRDLDGVRVSDILEIVRRPTPSMSQLPWESNDPSTALLDALHDGLEASTENCSLKALILRSVDPNVAPAATTGSSSGRTVGGDEAAPQP